MAVLKGGLIKDSPEGFMKKLRMGGSIGPVSIKHNPKDEYVHFHHDHRDLRISIVSCQSG